jgi:hypothetical protein
VRVMFRQERADPAAEVFGGQHGVVLSTVSSLAQFPGV